MNRPPDSGILQRGFWKRVQGQLILVLLVSLVPTLLIEAHLLRKWYNTARESELQANLQLARAVGKAFDGFVRDTTHLEYAVGLALTLSSPSVDEQRRYIEENFAVHPELLNLMWVSPKGVILISHLPQIEGKAITARSYFQEIAGGRDWAVSDLQKAMTTGQPMIAMAQGIRDKQGQLLGIVVASVHADCLGEVLKIDRPPGGGLALVDSKGMLVYRYPPIQQTWDERNWLRTFPEFGQALKEGKETEKAVFAPFEGKTRLVGFTPISSIGWAASAGRTEEIAMKKVVSQLVPQAALFLVIISASFGAALLCSRFIVKSVKRLRDQAVVLGSPGSVEPVLASGPLELRELAHSFNDMADKLRSRELSLRDQREWLRVTLSSIGDAVLTTDTAGNVTFMNPAAATLTAWTQEEAAGRSIQSVFQVIDEKTRKPAENIIERVLQEGCALNLANHRALVTRDGRQISIEDSAAPIRDAAGNILGVVLVFHDTTEKRKVQEALKASEGMLRTVLDQMPSGVAVRDARTGSLIIANARSRQILGELVDKPEQFGHYRVCHPDGRPYRTEEWPICRSMASGEVVMGEELQCDRGEGNRLTLSMSSAPVYDLDGRIVLGVAVFHDITGRKLMEEELLRAKDQLELRVRERTAELETYMRKLRESNQALQDFASIASHDLQEPLRKVISFGNVLKDGYADSIDEKGNDYLDRMLNATVRMQALLKSLLEYSRVTTEAEPLREVDIGVIVGEVLSDLEVLVRSTGGEVHVGGLPVLQADPTQMRQLFQNLIGNALKFHREGESPVVKVEGIPLDNLTYRIIVEDNGIGFENEHIQRIFLPFQRLHGRSSRYEGTGMGLAICKRIVKRHGGSITAQSTPGSGTRFIVDLPVRKPVIGRI